MIQFIAKILVDLLSTDNIYVIILLIYIGLYAIINPYQKSKNIKASNKIALENNKDVSYELIKDYKINKYIMIVVSALMIVLIVIMFNTQYNYTLFYLLMICFSVSQYFHAIYKKTYYKGDKSFIYHGKCIKYKDIIGSYKTIIFNYLLTIKGNENNFKIPYGLHNIIYTKFNIK